MVFRSKNMTAIYFIIYAIYYNIIYYTDYILSYYIDYMIYYIDYIRCNINNRVYISAKVTFKSDFMSPGYELFSKF